MVELGQMAGVNPQLLQQVTGDDAGQDSEGESNNEDGSDNEASAN